MFQTSSHPSTHLLRPCSRRVAKAVLTPACYEHPQRPLRALDGSQLLRQRRRFLKRP